MEAQKFKGDDLELQMEAVATPVLSRCSASLDDFMENGYTAADFLLMLYDQSRAPFRDRVPRDSFVEFMRAVIPLLPVTGTFEFYIFIVNAIFGQGSGVLFTVPAAGKLQMLVNAASTLVFDAVAREFTDGEFVVSELETSDGDTLAFVGLSGIDSEYELEQLLAELIPAGIFTEITLAFYAIYGFIASDGDSIVDHLNNQIVFFEGA